MGRLTGLSSFILLIDEIDYPYFLATQRKYDQFSEIVKEYRVTAKDESCDYHYVQLSVMDYHRSDEEICKFVLQTFPYIALHQEYSNYILVKDDQIFRGTINALYSKDTAKYFFYDMLSIEERGAALEEIDKDLQDRQVHLLHFDTVSGATYQLNFTTDSIYLFQEESEIELFDDMTGEYLTYDITKGMDIFNFKIAILGSKKLEKRT